MRPKHKAPPAVQGRQAGGYRPPRGVLGGARAAPPYVGMAFHNATRMYKCGRCSHERKYFGMIESLREADAFTEEDVDGIKQKRYKRICEKCELEARREEFGNRPHRWREKYPNYATEAAVHKSIKLKAKGDSWALASTKIVEAKHELQQKRQLGEKISQHELKHQAIKEGKKQLLGGILNALHDGDFFGALSSAGKRTNNIANQTLNYKEVLKNYLYSHVDEEGVHRMLVDIAADDLAKLNDYVACKDQGDKQKQLDKGSDAESEGSDDQYPTIEDFSKAEMIERPESAKGMPTDADFDRLELARIEEKAKAQGDEALAAFQKRKQREAATFITSASKVPRAQTPIHLTEGPGASGSSSSWGNYPRHQSHDQKMTPDKDYKC